MRLGWYVPEDKIACGSVKIKSSRTVEHPFVMTHTIDRAVDRTPHALDRRKHARPHRLLKTHGCRGSHHVGMSLIVDLQSAEQQQSRRTLTKPIPQLFNSVNQSSQNHCSSSYPGSRGMTTPPLGCPTRAVLCALQSYFVISGLSG